jgi:preprotein translocase subunit SecA
VLNALNPEQEAEIISQAGQPGRVTIATNMAGRGADIELAPSVRQAGGLHVIGTELHPAARIDRQLAGRCGRQGDPGSHRQFLSYDDEILAMAYGEARAKRLARSGGEVGPALFRQAQMRIEQEHFRQRQELMQFDRELRRASEALGLDPVLDAVE